MARRFHTTDGERRDRRVFIATPSYSGVSSSYVYSLMLSVPELKKHGFSVDWMHLEGNCHVDDARNDLVRAFLESDCTDIVFIDADMGWRPDDLAALLGFNKDVVAGSYCKKRDGSDFPVVLCGGENWTDEEGLLECVRVATGFLRFTRSAMQKLYDLEDKRRYLGKEDAPDRLPMAIIFERTYDGEHRISGDYSCCDKWRAIGGKIWVAPEMFMVHEGMKDFSGTLGSHIRRQRGLDLRPGIHKVRDGCATMDDIIGLCFDWGNDTFRARPELLYALAQIAREAKGPIIEAGSGISTLVMAASTKYPVYALENNSEWAYKTRQKAMDCGLGNVRVMLSELKDYGDFDWYSVNGELPDKFYFALCDGPILSTRGHRKGFMEIVGNKLIPGSFVVMDDAKDSKVSALAKSWFGDSYHVLGKDSFIVAEIPK